MIKWMFGASLVAIPLLAAPAPAKADQWGCTIFVCFSAPFDPMSIKDCAKAIVKMRPWKKPTCQYVDVLYQRDEVRMCPSEYTYLGEDEVFRQTDIRGTSRKTSTQRIVSRALDRDSNLFRQGICINPSTGRSVAPEPQTIYRARYRAGGQLYNIDVAYPSAE